MKGSAAGVCVARGFSVLQLVGVPILVLLVRPAFGCVRCDFRGEIFHNLGVTSLVGQKLSCLPVAIARGQVRVGLHQQRHHLEVASRRRSDERRVARVELVLILLVDVRLPLDQDLAQIWDAFARGEEQRRPVAVGVGGAAADLGERLALARVGLGPRVCLELGGDEDEIRGRDVAPRDREGDLCLGDAAQRADSVGICLQDQIDQLVGGVHPHLAILAHVGGDDDGRILEDMHQEVDLEALEPHGAQIERLHLWIAL
mmetsp:Transcript_21206/g.47584  ORF Transcript_21206/g.47584 Transcript_21206/m.47584 type:complete len:258 (-) Transcript_21206:1001-1774(-)